MIVTEPQSWVLIGVFAAAMFGVLGLIIPLVNRATRATVGELRGELRGEIGGLRGDLRGEIQALRGEMVAGFKAVDAKFEAVDAKFEAKFDLVNSKLAKLDTEVGMIARKVYGVPD